MSCQNFNSLYRRLSKVIVQYNNDNNNESLNFTYPTLRSVGDLTWNDSIGTGSLRLAPIWFFMSVSESLCKPATQMLFRTSKN